MYWKILAADVLHIKDVLVSTAAESPPEASLSRLRLWLPLVKRKQEHFPAFCVAGGSSRDS